MGQTCTRSEDVSGNIGRDRSVVIPIKHCCDAKKQEMRVRVITLLLLLGCVVLSIFAASRDSSDVGSEGQESAESGALANQLSAFRSDNPTANSNGLHIGLELMHTGDLSDGRLIQWKVQFGDSYNAEKCAIVIPDTGKYFVYIKIVLGCQNEDRSEKHKKTLFVKLQKWSRFYNKTRELTDALEDIVCNLVMFRTVFVGELFELTKGDHVSVFIAKGYNLITKSSFGAYLT
ncbi:hypothetical protein PAMA_008165 [Pampus argenteus]